MECILEFLQYCTEDILLETVVPKLHELLIPFPMSDEKGDIDSADMESTLVDMTSSQLMLTLGISIALYWSPCCSYWHLFQSRITSRTPCQMMCYQVPRYLDHTGGTPLVCRNSPRVVLICQSVAGHMKAEGKKIIYRFVLNLLALSFICCFMYSFHSLN